MPRPSRRASVFGWAGSAIVTVSPVVLISRLFRADFADNQVNNDHLAVSTVTSTPPVALPNLSQQNATTTEFQNSAGSQQQSDPAYNTLMATILEQNNDQTLALQDPASISASDHFNPNQRQNATMVPTYTCYDNQHLPYDDLEMVQDYWRLEDDLEMIQDCWLLEMTDMDIIQSSSRG
jgi:hypothetical protein